MKAGFIAMSIISLLFLSGSFCFAQEPEMQEPATSERFTEPEVQWTLGTVLSVDLDNKTVLVKYLDYETDSEKEINITLNNKTTLENIQSLEEIKPEDTVSIDYMVNADGKNIAKNIGLEKPEESETPQQKQATEEVAPEDLQQKEDTEEATPENLEPFPTVEE